LAVGLGVGDNREPGLAPQSAEIVSGLSGVELSAIVENDGARNAEASDDVPPHEPLYFNCSYGGDGFSLYPFSKVVDYHKEILGPPRCFGERS